VDPRLERILVHPGLRILSAVQKNKKLDQIILVLESQANQVQTNVNPSGKSLVKPPERKRPNLGTAAEISRISDWLTRFQQSPFDPETTFPRLIVKSTRDVCESKRKYKSEKDAIIALINLEEIKGQLVKQLPYRCNICHEYHNTHLISRELFEKLRKKYQK
jgi:hypothetical protein